LYTRLAVALLAAPLLVACSSSAQQTPGTETGTLTVFAATSLKGSFDEIGKRFEAAHPGIKVTVNYNGSATLAQQITTAGGADVFASADQPNMDKVVKAGVADGTGRLFATNSLMIAVRPGNPKHITSLADLVKPGTTVVLCDDPQPCGAAALKAEKAAGITIAPASKEQNVGGVLAKVRSGDADAGLVYRTDVRGAGAKITGVEFPEATQAINNYPVVVLKDTKLATTARDFAEFIRTGGGQEVLATNGFGKP